MSKLVKNNNRVTYNLKYAVYEHALVVDNNQLIKRHFIVIKSNGVIIAWTDFHRYILANNRIRHITSNDSARFYAVVTFLNYVFYGKYQIARLTDISAQMVIDFCNDYGMCKLSGDNEFTHRTKDSVERCLSYIIDFLTEFQKQNPNTCFDVNALYHREDRFSKTRKKYISVTVPNFQIRYKSTPKPIFRDIPGCAFKVIMSKIVDDYTDILMLAACSAFAGLRPSEACNVRREDSSIGAGISFDSVNNEISSITLDLTKEHNLRSDLVSVGGIKKERKQSVYPAFLDVFYNCYKIYMDYIKGRKYESEFGPLTINNKGLAMTYPTYYQRFQCCINDCIPEMLNSNDPELLHYGQLLLEHRISPHIFRHWFSVKLTIYGEDVSNLMFWRGDKNPTSALQYIMNKSDLQKQHNVVVDEIFKYTSWKAEKKYGNG